MKKPLSTFRYALLTVPTTLYTIKYGWRALRNKPNALVGAPLWYLRYMRQMKADSDSDLSSIGWLAEREYKKQRQLRIKQ